MGLCYRWQLDLGLTDTDAWADWAAARTDSLADLAGQVVKPLTGGVGGGNANFYRPVVMLHYALQQIGRAHV